MKVRAKRREMIGEGARKMTLLYYGAKAFANLLAWKDGGRLKPVCRVR